MMGCASEPPHDVAHVQFQSRIAFKLVWCPPSFSTFVLVDDDGKLLVSGAPTGQLPRLSERRSGCPLGVALDHTSSTIPTLDTPPPLVRCDGRLNFGLVQGSKYAVEAEKVGV